MDHPEAEPHPPRHTGLATVSRGTLATVSRGTLATVVLGVTALMMGAACGTGNGATSAGRRETSSTSPVPKLQITPASFKALTEMTPVRGFFVDNLVGDLDGTLAVARSPTGGRYPVGSVVQLVPGEAMVKREPGFAPTVNDWEFFELDVSATGTTIRKRGGAEIVNRFGGSCSACHLAADPQWDLICENDHGCDFLPLDDTAIRAIQLSDPRPATMARSTTSGG